MKYLHNKMKTGIYRIYLNIMEIWRHLNSGTIIEDKKDNNSKNLLSSLSLVWSVLSNDARTFLFMSIRQDGDPSDE